MGQQGISSGAAHLETFPPTPLLTQAQVALGQQTRGSLVLKQFFGIHGNLPSIENENLISI